MSNRIVLHNSFKSAALQSNEQKLSEMFKYAGMLSREDVLTDYRISDGENGLGHAWKSRKADAYCGRKVGNHLTGFV
jgi:hypothetical protein